MEGTEQPDVRIRGIVKRFGAFEAVAGIDLDVTPGQFVTHLGQPGCGKTTTLRIIGGLEQPGTGVVLVASASVDGASASAIPAWSSKATSSCRTLRARRMSPSARAWANSRRPRSCRSANSYVADFVGETNFLPSGIALRPENVAVGAPVPQARGQETPRSKSFAGAGTRLEIESGGAIIVATAPGMAAPSSADSVAFGWCDEDTLSLSKRDSL